MLELEVPGGRCFGVHHPESYLGTPEMCENLFVGPREPISPVIKPSDLGIEVAIKRRWALRQVFNADAGIIDARRIEVFTVFELKIGSGDFEVHGRSEYKHKDTKPQRKRAGGRWACPRSPKSCSSE